MRITCAQQLLAYAGFAPKAEEKVHHIRKMYPTTVGVETVV